MTYTDEFINEAIAVLSRIERSRLEACAECLAEVRDRGGRLFVVGVGGSAAHASHAVNDFRKLCGFEAYTPTDNVSELTARINDDGWETSFAHWLTCSRFGRDDGLLVFSVGGGDEKRGVSTNLIASMDLAQR